MYNPWATTFSPQSAYHWHCLQSSPPFLSHLISPQTHKWRAIQILLLFIYTIQQISWRGINSSTCHPHSSGRFTATLNDLIPHYRLICSRGAPLLSHSPSRFLSVSVLFTLWLIYRFLFPLLQEWEFNVPSSDNHYKITGILSMEYWYRKSNETTASRMFIPLCHYYFWRSYINTPTQSEIVWELGESTTPSSWD